MAHSDVVCCPQYFAKTKTKTKQKNGIWKQHENSIWTRFSICSRPLSIFKNVIELDKMAQIYVFIWISKRPEQALFFSCLVVCAVFAHVWRACHRIMQIYHRRSGTVRLHCPVCVSLFLSAEIWNLGYEKIHPQDTWAAVPKMRPVFLISSPHGTISETRFLAQAVFFFSANPYIIIILRSSLFVCSSNIKIPLAQRQKGRRRWANAARSVGERDWMAQRSRTESIG